MNYQGNTLSCPVSVQQLISLHYFNFGKNYDFTGESHDFWELVFVDSGEITVTDGKSAHILEQGQIFLHHPGVFHNITANNRYSNVAVIGFRCQCAALHDVPRFPVSLATFEKQLINMIIEEGAKAFDEPLNLIYLEKMTKKTLVPFGAEQRIKCAVEMLLVSLIRAESATLNESDKSTYAQVKTVNAIKKLLTDSVRTRITLEYISDRLGYSQTYLKTLFKKRTGTSIIKYFNGLKVLEAKKLISENEHSFSDIAALLGYDSVQYFSTQFKAYANMTPSEYLKSIKILKVL